MTRVELAIPNPRTLNRRLESSEVVLPANDDFAEADWPMTEAERLDTSIRLILDVFYSLDGTTWIHRLRYQWQGGTYSGDALNEIPRVPVVQLNLPRNARVRLSADRVR